MLYIMYIPLLLYGGKSAQQLSYGFNILDKLESCPHENQIPYGDMDFLKKVSKVTDFRSDPFLVLYFYMGEKVHYNYLMGLIFSTSWSVAPTKIKFLMGIWIFQKRFQK